MLGRVCSACLSGIEATLVRVEVDVSHGLPLFATVGLPDPAIRESRERVRAAVRHSGFTFPLDRITVSLAPADVPKEGASFDLAIALGLLAATGAIRPELLGRVLVAGELALDGAIHPVRGVLPMALAARAAGVAGALLAPGNVAEAAVVEGLAVHPVLTLGEAAAFLNGERPIAPAAVTAFRPAAGEDDELDLADVRGQAPAKRALEIAAAGGHHAILVGPPGTGKTMLARRVPALLPPLDLAEAVEVSRVWSVAGQLPCEGLVARRPFRAPHHTVSAAGLVGGGRGPLPGEASLAHLGVLFLDELPEFAPHVLDTLRQPLEEGTVTVTRARGSVRFPAAFQLVGAMNFCRRACRSLDACACTPAERARYLGRLSAPFLDRIDVHVALPPVPAPGEAATVCAPGESVAARRRVSAARERQQARLGRSAIPLNARMTPRQVGRHCALDGRGRMLLQCATERLGLSARAHDRVLVVARTIADLAGAPRVGEEHLAEALQYRVLDRAPAG